MVRAAPTATPKKGAIHGVATTVARKPEKKEPLYPLLFDNFAPNPTNEIPISKTPLRLNPKTRRKIAKKKTNNGSCS